MVQLDYLLAHLFSLCGKEVTPRILPSCCVGVREDLVGCVEIHGAVNYQYLIDPLQGFWMGKGTQR